MNAIQTSETVQFPQVPVWIDDLVIYEIATKSFTSPNGPESGTFDSLCEKLSYVRDLGATGIWLTGHSLSDPSHFYNIWTQYACIMPDQLDSSLGDAAAFKRLIDTAHAYGIKVFLDVITHGIMAGSPLITDKPEWFKGGSWGMIDYDWYGDHPDLDAWWVDVWSRYVEEYGIDGYRLDVATYRPDLWNRIRQRCADGGHPIVVFAELGPAYAGASDFLQWGERLSINHGFVHDSPLLTDVARYFQRAVTPAANGFDVLIEYTDGTKAGSGAEAQIALTVNELGERERLVVGPNDLGTYGIREQVLEVDGAPAGKTIDNVTVRHPGHPWPWQIHGNTAVDFTVTIEGDAPRLRLVLPMRQPGGTYLSVQLSCHDNGWDGFPLDQNPYAAQGSRFVFGYACLLTPAVPIFMSGEEFNAAYRPLPQHSPRLFGGELFGQGRWLYASWLDWSQLQDPARAAMLQDVQRLIRIRRDYARLIRPLRVGDGTAHIVAAAFTADRPAPTPYLYRALDECLLVAGNPDREQDLQARFALAESLPEWPSTARLTVRDLWSDAPSFTCTLAEFTARDYTIPCDGEPGGGMLVLHLQHEAA